MITMLKGIPLDEVTQIRTTANAIGPIAVALFIVAAESHGYPPEQLQRPAPERRAEGVPRARDLRLPAAPAAVRFAVDVVEYCARNLPTWEPIEFCGYHIRDSGSTAVQEVAIALANGIEYLDAALARGLDIDAFAPSIYLFFSAHLDVFEEVAKFRAARRLWSKLLERRFGATKPESLRANIFCYTLGSPQTATEPLNNIVRIAYQTMAAVLGGVQTLATSSFDEALGLPSEDAVRIALRTQQILAYETGVARSADPLGGSYLVERLTDEFEAAVWDYMGKIEAEGGALAALESGWLHAELDAQAYRHQVAVDRGERVVVGVNRFEVDTPRYETHAPMANATTELEQIERLQQVKAQRDDDEVRRSLDQLEKAAIAQDNTIPALLDAVRCYATVGEICSVLARHWGRFDEHHR